MGIRGKTTTLSIAVLALAGGCTAGDPDGPLADVDLVLAVDTTPGGVTSAEVVGALPRGMGDSMAPRPGDGRLEVLFVDADRDEVLAHGRVAAPQGGVLERFSDEGIEGEPFHVEEGRVLVAVPAPSEGRGRLTLRTVGGTDVAFEVGPSGPDETFEARSIEPVAGDRSLPGATRGALSEDVAPARQPLVETDSCGDGEVDREWNITLSDVLSLEIFPEQCDDGNREDGDGCSSDCRHEMVHLGGAEEAAGTIRIVLVPHRWESFEAFEEYASTQVAGVFASDPVYREWEDRISFWALESDEVNEEYEPAISCETAAGDVQSLLRRVQSRDALLARYAGDLSLATRMVLVHPEECGFAWAFPGDIVFLSSTFSDEILAHELGHNLGHLADEYPYGSSVAEDYPCQTEYERFGFELAPPNVSTDGSSWSCLLENVGGATCPGGGHVHRSPIGGACGTDGGFTPCARCLMGGAEVGFCPVCRAHMDARLADILGDSRGEACGNGADDDLDGEADEGCSCECTPTACGSGSGERACGSDGCFGSCGGCGVGKMCGADHRCEAECPGASCRDGTGRDVCAGRRSLLVCDAEAGTSRFCTCSDAGEWVDCTVCEGRA